MIPSVGVAPGTTTIRLDGPSCPPTVQSGYSWLPAGSAATTTARPSSQGHFLNPYADVVALKGDGLGMVLSPYGQVPNAYPWEINRTGPNNAPQLTPLDYQYNQRGETGFYYDTQLGDGDLGDDLGVIPTDAEMGRNLCYTPVHTGWVYGKEADGQRYYYPGPWSPPNGWQPTGPDRQWAPPVALGGGFGFTIPTRTALIVGAVGVAAAALGIFCYVRSRR